MASQASVPRSVPAGDREQQQQPAQEGLRRSGRVKKTLPTYSNPEMAHRPPREGDRGTPGPRKESPGTSWGERSSGESTSTFSSRVVAMLREYEDAGKALTGLKEKLQEARILNTRASSKEKPVTSQRFRALRDEVARLVLLREGIEKSTGPFLERFKNQRRFSEMKGLNTSGEPPAGVLSDEEEEDDDVAVTGVLQAGTSRESESQSRQQRSGLPARQRTPTAQAGVSAEEEEEGGLLQEIRQLESPVNLDRFSFGEDEPAEETQKRKKKTKETAREVVSYRYVLMDDVTPTTSCVNPTKPKGTGSAVGPGHRQGGERRRTSGGAAVCAGNSAGGEAVEVLTAPDIGDPEEFPSLPSAAKPVITGAEGGEGDVHAVAKGGRCGQTPSLLATAEPADAGAVGGRSEKLGAAKGGRTVVTGAQCASTEKRHAAAIGEQRVQKGKKKQETSSAGNTGRPAATGGQIAPAPKCDTGTPKSVGAGQAAPPNKQQAQNNKIQTAAVGGQGAPETQQRASTNQGKTGGLWRGFQQRHETL
ncbi:uncharacterized protein LOC143781472 [Ranitomeya variabilis]|uniref:uncharacterized protein LOC143781472 n=1 Tax=Ranitomeya variabilis TaxID=490064 RepID=UPI004055A451